MSILHDLRNTFVSHATEKSLYEEIKDTRYNQNVISLESMDKLLSIENKLERWCKILDIDEYVFERCHDCQSLDYQDELRTAYEEYTVCQTCIDDEYTYSEYRDTYVRYEDADDDEESYDDDHRDDNVYSWDYNVMEQLSMTSTKSDKLHPDTPYYGIELEVEKRNSADEETATNIHNSFTYGSMQFALLKGDGSLSNGFEIVSCPGTFNAHKKYWDKFFNSEAIKEVKSWNTDTTGMHIHISRTALTQLQIGKILVFINDEKNQEFVNHIAGRSSDQWAKKSNKKISDCVVTSGKYEAVNTAHRNTIELRIFKGNLARHGFYRVLEFVDALVHFAKLTSLTKLQYTDFLTYMERPSIRSQYPNFYGWLTRKSYCVGKPSRKVDWTDELSNLKEIA
jgi:hypothetical protein